MNDSKDNSNIQNGAMRVKGIDAFIVRDRLSGFGHRVIPATAFNPVDVAVEPGGFTCQFLLI
jgi:hypothetical protein